ncbi:hypothetical protein GALMADRAFT_270137 [Galerina marginata CBS 339.88]|uniref:HNH nuclease domain-containing protein n=1 Tax=Galerina marginata (strain CBS 339.88) TaxID=685588 RepID=A0A067STC3_GALM3|nr:hypothetical protein GALMADRAFT_270137 [Galerina marginata CBS 339.88]
MTPLPPKVPERLQDDVHVHAVSAYNICLSVESSLQLAVNNGENVEKDIIYIRILGYLIHFVPTDLGLTVVVAEIFSAKSDRDLLNVGKTYFDHFIRAFRANRGRTPTPSNHASPRSFDTVADMVNDTLEHAPQSHSTAKKHALIRDGYCCVVTGKYDMDSVLVIKELRDKLNADRSLETDGTQCAHIFAEFTNQDIELGPHKVFIIRFGYTQLPDDLNGSNVHRLENVMTVAPGFQLAFDQLKVWLVATNVENKYKLEATERFFLNGYPKFVTFKTPDPVKFPVPSAVYLSIHAACAKITHLSGAGACIDEFYRDMYDSTTLDPNGASAEMLEHALFELRAAGRPVPSLLE